MIPSTKQQRQLIGIACGQLGIEKSIKEDMLLERFGKGSTTEISRLQADEFLRELRSKGFRVARKGRSKRRVPARQAIPREGSNTISMVSKEELEKIAAVSALIQWRVEDGLALWMKKRLGIEKIRRSGDACQVIEGLKKMFENGMKKMHGADWWVRLYADPGIETYIQEHCPLEFRTRMFATRWEAGLID